MSFLYLVLSLDKTIEGINSILPIVSYRNKSHQTNFLTFALNKALDDRLNEKCLPWEIYSAIFIELVELVDIGPG